MIHTILIMILSTLFHRQQDYAVYGPNGGIATHITLPDGFNPETDKCPMVILMHGFMAKKEGNPIPSVAKALAKEGIASVSFDFDAHGKSEGRFIDMTISSEISDAKAVFDYVCKLPYVSKIAFACHSQGGVIGGMLAGQLNDNERKPVCLVLLAPAAVLKDDAIKGQCMFSHYDASNPPEYVNVMMHKLGRKFILEAQKLPIYETSGQYDGKVCLIHGTKDKIVPLSYSEKYHEIYPGSELHIIDGENHFFSKKKNEVVGIAVSFLKENLR